MVGVRGVFWRVFFLMAVQRSRCDKFAEAYFRHSGAGGYIFEGDIEKFESKLRAFERGKVDELEI